MKSKFKRKKDTKLQFICIKLLPTNLDPKLQRKHNIEL